MYLDDPLTMYPRLGSYVPQFYACNPMALCDVGHQGLFWEREYQKYNNRIRIYDPQGRFLQHDPMEYIDGMNMYEYVKSSPILWVDPYGLWTWAEVFLRATGGIGRGATEEAQERQDRFFNNCKDAIMNNKGTWWPAMEKKVNAHIGIQVMLTEKYLRAIVGGTIGTIGREGAELSSAIRGAIFPPGAPNINTGDPRIDSVILTVNFATRFITTFQEQLRDVGDEIYDSQKYCQEVIDMYNKDLNEATTHKPKTAGS